MPRVIARWTNGLGESVVSPVSCSFTEIDDNQLARYVVVKGRHRDRQVMLESDVHLGILFDDGSMMFSEEYA